MKKITLFLLLLVLLTVPAFAAPTVDPSEKVYDFSNTIDQSVENALRAKAQELSAKTGVSFVIVFCTGNTEVGLVDYADSFYNNFQGESGTENCAMMTVDMSIRNVRVDMFGSLRRKISDSNCDDIRTAFSPSLSRGSYDEACNIFLDEAYEYMETKIGFNPDGTLVKVNVAISTVLIYALFVAIGIIVIMLLVTFVVNKKSLAPPKARQYLDRNSFRMSYARDVFVSTHTTRTEIKSSTGGGGGGGSRSSGSQGRF